MLIPDSVTHFIPNKSYEKIKSTFNADVDINVQVQVQVY